MKKNNKIFICKSFKQLEWLIRNGATNNIKEINSDTAIFYIDSDFEHMLKVYDFFTSYYKGGFF